MAAPKYLFFLSNSLLFQLILYITCSHLLFKTPLHRKMERLINCLLPCVKKPKLASEDEVEYEQNRLREAQSAAIRAFQELQGSPQRNVSQMQYKEVITLFRLKRDRQPVFNLRDSELIPVPKRLDGELEDVKSFFADLSDKEISRL